MSDWNLRLLGVGNAAAVELGSAMATIERDATPWLTIDCGGEGLTAYQQAYADMPMAVGVVKLVHARCSGVAFSAHPVTGKRDRIVIEGNWGWGEAVVQGLVTPDHIEVGKSDNRVLRYDVAHKAIVSAFDYSIGAIVEIDMPDNLADRAILNEEEVCAIARAVSKIEEHYGYPVDVEWVLDRHRRPDEEVSIVQARPVTVAEPEEEAKGDAQPLHRRSQFVSRKEEIEAAIEAKAVERLLPCTS